MKCCNFGVGAVSYGVFSRESACRCPCGQGESGSLEVGSSPFGFHARPCPLPAAALLWVLGREEGARGSCWGGKAPVFASHPTGFSVVGCAVVGVALQGGAREAK